MKLKTNKTQKGFTLTELLVSIAIMVFILALVLVNYRKFDSSIVLTNLAYDIGLSVRKAQSYGISVKGTNEVVANPNAFKYPYGIHFDTANPKSYIIFADMNDNGDGTLGNGSYDCLLGESDSSCEKVEKYFLQGGYRIKELCSSADGTTDNNCAAITVFDITFKRPNPDAKIYSNIDIGNEAAVIKIHSAQSPDEFKRILIRTTGQISIPNEY